MRATGCRLVRKDLELVYRGVSVPLFSYPTLQISADPVLRGKRTSLSRGLCEVVPLHLSIDFARASDKAVQYITSGVDEEVLRYVKMCR